MDYLKSLISKSKRADELRKSLEIEGSTVHLSQMVGGAFSLYAATITERLGGIHVFLMEDKDRAAYLANDLYELLDEEHVAFFASGYKRSAAYGAEDAQGLVRRTATLNAITTHTTSSTLTIIARFFSICVSREASPTYLKYAIIANTTTTAI